MSNYEKYINISNDEKILEEVEGDAYNQNSSPIARIIGTFIRIVSIILGFRMKTHIIVTNKRIIRLDFKKILWFINKGVTAMSMTPRSIGSVGYSNERVFLLFKTRFFIINTSTEKVYIKFQGNDKLLMTVVDKVSNLLESIKTK